MLVFDAYISTMGTLSVSLGHSLGDIVGCNWSKPRTAVPSGTEKYGLIYTSIKLVWHTKKKWKMLEKKKRKVERRSKNSIQCFLNMPHQPVHAGTVPVPDILFQAFNLIITKIEVIFT